METSASASEGGGGVLDGAAFLQGQLLNVGTTWATALSTAIENESLSHLLSAIANDENSEHGSDAGSASIPTPHTSAGQAVNLSNLSTESANLNKPQLVSTIANQDWLSTHCVVCNARGHLVDDCPQSYHFYLKPGATITKVPLSEFPVRISCYKCASTQHLGDDCPTDPNPVKSVFSAAFYNQFLTEPLPEPNLDSAVLTERDITSGAPTSAPKTPRKVKQANNPPSKQLAQHQNQNQYPNQQNQSQQMQIQIHNLNLDQQSLNQNQQNQNRNAGMLGNHRVERAPPPPIAPFSPQYYPPGPPSWHYRR